jgi:hypothetical protein
MQPTLTCAYHPESVSDKATELNMQLQIQFAQMLLAYSFALNFEHFGHPEIKPTSLTLDIFLLWFL